MLIRSHGLEVSPRKAHFHNQMKRNVERRKERIKSRTTTSSQVLNPKPAWGSKVKSVPTPHQRAASFLQMGTNTNRQRHPQGSVRKPRSHVSLPRVVGGTRAPTMNAASTTTNRRGGSKKPTNVSLPSISTMSISNNSKKSTPPLGLGVVGASARMR